MVGLRPAELLGLSWDDVHFEAGTPRVRHPLKRIDGKLVLADLKTPTSRRTLRMPQAVAAALKADRQARVNKQMNSGIWQDQGVVFPGREAERARGGAPQI